MLKAVIIDDEHDAIESVKLLLKENFTNISIVDTAQSVKDGEKIIKDNKPDIVFLDVEMLDGTGFDLLEKIEERDFSVIFITAYNQYAIKAFKYSAIDYILKPIGVEEFIEAVNKIENTNNKTDNNIDILLENIKKEKPEKIALSTTEGIEFVKISDIIYVCAEGSYSTLRFVDSSELVVSKNIGELESLLVDYTFYRSHQSYLINLLHVKKVTRSDNEVVMDDGSVTFLSRRKKKQFMELMTIMVQNK
jgi:two-component system LytT family response regulator